VTRVPLKGPELVKTIVNTVGVRSSWRRAPVSSSINACDNAFRFLGLFSSKTATPPSFIDTTRTDGSGISELMAESTFDYEINSQVVLARPKG
jgi:hypothetical protein